MNEISLSLSLVIVSTLFYNIDSKYVKIGDYPEAKSMGVNREWCGLNGVPQLIEHIVNTTVPRERRCLYRYMKRKSRETMTTVPSGRIWNGMDAPSNEAPWVVYLQFTIVHPYHVTHTMKCTGVLITHQWVLTAAHCANERNGDYAVVYAGDNKRVGGQQIISYSDNWFPNEKWFDSVDKKKGDYDISLMKLDKKYCFPITDDGFFTINPICLPGKEFLQRSDNAFYYGFGVIETSGWGKIFDKHPEYLKRGKANVRRCDNSDTKLCADLRNTESRPCGADSGGPLVQFDKGYKAVLLGTLQGGVGKKDYWGNLICTDEVHPSEGQWMAVPLFIDWILDTMKKH